jgi:antitoxin VapB
MNSPIDTAKIFTTGRSQAVRLPKAYRFDTEEVFIERKGDLVILRPKHDKNQWWNMVEKALAGFEGMPPAIARHRGRLPDDIENLD